MAEANLKQLEAKMKRQQFRRRNRTILRGPDPEEEMPQRSPSDIIGNNSGDDIDRNRGRWTQRLDTMDLLRPEGGNDNNIQNDNSSFEASVDDKEDSVYSSCSLSIADDLDGIGDALMEEDGEQGLEMLPLTEPKSFKKKEFDVGAYMDGREMTAAQEKWNAITVVPNPIYCLHFLLAGRWLSQDAIELARVATKGLEDLDPTVENFNTFVEEGGCIDSNWFPNLHACPPLPVIAVALGIVLHAPFSFLYHWHYASRLPPGMARIDHWSRRLDHAFIHVISALMSYGTSGRWDYFLANLMYNLECIHRQFRKKVRPRANKIRILISLIAYTIPILRRGEITLFLELWLVFVTAAWLFAAYPIGGWSHAAFHAAIALAPPLLLVAASRLEASQGQIAIAARCAILAGK